MDNLEYALILEDDACFDKEWKQKVNQFNIYTGGVKQYKYK